MGAHLALVLWIVGVATPSKPWMELRFPGCGPEVPVRLDLGSKPRLAMAAPGGCPVSIRIGTEGAPGSELRLRANGVLWAKWRIEPAEAAGSGSGRFTLESALPGPVEQAPAHVVRIEAELVDDLGRSTAGAVELQYQGAAGETGHPGALDGAFEHSNGPVLVFPSPSQAQLGFFLSEADLEDVRVELRPSQGAAATASRPITGEEGWRSVSASAEADVVGYPRRPWSLVRSSRVVSPGSDFWDRSVVLPRFETNHYRVRFDGLSPKTRYDYRVLVRRPLVGFVHAFPAASFETPPSSGPFSLAAISDLRSYDGGDRQEMVRQVLASVLEAGLAQFVVLPGDVSNQAGTSFQYWQHFFAVYRDQTKRFPFYPIHGNHDLARAGDGSLDGYAFFHLMELPANPVAEALVHHRPGGGAARGYRSFYSFDWGDAHFVALDAPALRRDLRRRDGNSDSFQSVGRDSAQYRWLAEDLALNRGARWRIAFMHAPPEALLTLEDRAASELFHLLVREKVHLVLAGHWEFPFFSPSFAPGAPDGARQDADAGILPFVVMPSGGARNRDERPEWKTTPPIPERCAVHTSRRHGLVVIRGTEEALYLTQLDKRGERAAELVVGRSLDGAPEARSFWQDTEGCEDDTGRVRVR